MTLDFYLTRGMIERAAFAFGPNPYQEKAAVSVWLALCPVALSLSKTNWIKWVLPQI